jgi:hypothetical protein
MGVDPSLIVVAIVSALASPVVVIAGVVFCRKALQRGTPFEAEIKAPFVSLKFAAREYRDQTGPPSKQQQVESYDSNVVLIKNALTDDGSKIDQP